MSWVNSKAIELVGITEDTPNPPGGEIIKNEDGTIRGVVTDQAQDLFMKKVPVYDDEDQKKINLLAQDEFLKFGLTSVHDMGASPHDLEIREGLYADGRMKVRTYNTLRVPGTSCNSPSLRKTKTLPLSPLSFLACAVPAAILIVCARLPAVVSNPGECSAPIISIFQPSTLNFSMAPWPILPHCSSVQYRTQA